MRSNLKQPTKQQSGRFCGCLFLFCQNHPAISAHSVKPINIVKQLKTSHSLSFRSIFHYFDTWTCLFSRVVLLATSCRHTQLDLVSEGCSLMHLRSVYRSKYLRADSRLRENDAGKRDCIETLMALFRIFDKNLLSLTRMRNECGMSQYFYYLRNSILRRYANPHCRDDFVIVCFYFAKIICFVLTNFSSTYNEY
jgi:hypothetical protein